MMKVTTSTTDEQLNASVEAARRRLTSQVAGGVSAEYLADAVNSVAEAEGEREARWSYRQVRENGGSHEAAMTELYHRLANGAGDTWSGRGNDTRRARFDGFRSAVQVLRWQKS